MCKAPYGHAPGLPGDGMGLEGCVLAERGGYACPGGQVGHWSGQQGPSVLCGDGGGCVSMRPGSGGGYFKALQQGIWTVSGALYVVDGVRA